MHFSSGLCLFIALVCQVSCEETIIGLYGETVEVPCNKGAPKPKDLIMTKWKYNNGALLTQSKDKNVTVKATKEYMNRVSMTEDSSLLIAGATLKDEQTFTCMIVVDGDISEFPVKVIIHKAPTTLDFTSPAAELEIGKPTQLGICSAHDANPAAVITWYKNKKPLLADGKGIVISSALKVDNETGLTTTTSVLSYTAVKEDADAFFTCGTLNSSSSPISFNVTYPTEKVSLQVVSKGPFKEGDNLTLRCKADGNPPPTSFNFHIKGKVVKVENSDTYTLTKVTRKDTGEYKCSLIDNAKMEDSKNLTINYLDMSLGLPGKVTKRAGEGLTFNLADASGELESVAWKKDNVKLNKQPAFEKLTYADSGKYEVVVTMGPLNKTAYFELVVEGVPVIQQLKTQKAKDSQHSVLLCTAEGFPKPTVSWSVNGTVSSESSYINGEITHSLTIVPSVNLTVACTVSNELGQDTKFVNVSILYEEVKMDKQDSSEDSDSTKLVVGLVVSLLLTTVVVGLVYWLYMKKSKQGSWTTGEKDDGSNEESKKLEEKIDEKLEENIQKVEV
ncbi:hypothetical protein UPYG_G00201120 [Umbra pygmaea]|uniref:Ig-like domain-containing protein n=1 Tax=Umbra pygmaea TaxID=75934 RepID=A0ABD0WI91_UMBPY